MRHQLTDGAGLALAVVITTAGRPEQEAIAMLLEARIVRAPGGGSSKA